MAETFNISLDMDKTKRHPATITARVGDVDSINVVAQLYSGTEPYTPVGTSAYFECVCPNGYAVRQTASISGTSVSVTLVPEVFQAPGVINDAYFRFENGASTDPTYVESTESFVILVYSSVDDNVDTGDYIAEWRTSQTLLDSITKEAQESLPTIQGAVNSVEQAASGAITDINEAKKDVEAAAADVMTPINNAIDKMNETVQGALSDFNSDAQAELSAFDTNASTKINQFETNASGKLTEYDSDVNEFISSAQSSVDSNIKELDDATQKAIDAMESALTDDQYGDLLQRISRDWKLTLQDMVILSGTVDLNLVNVGTFALSPSGATISNAPVTGNTPFILFSGQYFETMKYQLALYPSGETQIYIRYQTGTGSGSDVVWGAWSSWSSISGGGGGLSEDVLTRVLLTDSKYATMLDAGDDLNDCTLGTYMCALNGFSDIKNQPMGHKGAFILSAGTFYGNPDTDTTLAAIQIAIYPHMDDKLWYRTRQAVPVSGGSDEPYFWQDWSAWAPMLTASASIETPVSIANGGTGATTAEQARTNLGAGTSNFSGDYNDLENKPTIPTVPSLPLSIANGGTGANTASGARANFGLDGVLTAMSTGKILKNGSGVGELAISSTASPGTRSVNFSADNTNASINLEATGSGIDTSTTISCSSDSSSPLLADFSTSASSSSSYGSSVSIANSSDDMTTFAPEMSFKQTMGGANKFLFLGIDSSTSSYVGTYADPVDFVYADSMRLSTPLPIVYGGTGATTAAQARANLGITSGGGSGGMSIKLYDKSDLNFVFPNTSSYTLITYHNGTIPFSGFVQNGTYEFTGSCVIFSMMLTRKMITNPGYPYLLLSSRTMDNSTATATFDSNHGFNLFGNMSSNSISSLHPFPYIGSAGRDFWNCGYIIGRIHTNAPTSSSMTLTSGTPYIVPFSLRFDTDGWCKMLLNCQANQYINDYLTIDSLIVPPINIGVGGSVLS